MAKELVTFTYCDIHLQDKDEQVEAQTYQGFTGTSQSVDLCHDCAAPLLTVQTLMDDYGAKGSRTRRPRRQAQSSSPDAMTCPDCGAVSRNRDSLASHARQAHGKGLGQLLGEPVPYACPDCDRAFSTPQGLGAHQARTHGRTRPDGESASG